MQGHVLDSINVAELGDELRKARRRAGLTQEKAAQKIDVARTTLTAIEKGERRIKADELIKLAQAYGQQISDFVRPRPKLAAFTPQFRGPYVQTEEDKSSIDQAIAELESLCRNYLELEEITGIPLVRRYPPEYDISGLPTERAAESIALEERTRLGLGDGPLPLLRDILEQDVGLRIFYLPLPSKFSAIYIYTDQLGGCIALNSNHPEERNRWSLSHDYWHFLTSRYRATVSVEDAYHRRPENERLADSFAMYFLMPAAGLTKRFADIKRSTGAFTTADLCTMAHFYGVSVEAITQRLEMMQLLPTGMWDKLRDAGFKVREAQQQLGLGAIPARIDKLPIRYQYLALDAFNRELIGEGQFAHFLQVDRLEARRIADVLQQQSGSDSATKSRDVNMTQSVIG